MKFKPIFNIADEDFKKYLIITFPLVIGLGMTFSNEVFFRFFGSFLGTGGLSSINYSLRTMLPLVGVFGQASGVASYPFLSRLAVENKIRDMNQLLNGIVHKIGSYLIPICAIMMVLATQIIAILFQHGKFSAASTHATAPVLVLYLAGAFFFAASTIVMRNFYALQNTLFPMVISTIIAAASIPGYLLLSKLLGARGIALAASLAMFMQFTFLYWIWSLHRSNMPEFIQTVTAIVKMTGISIAGALLAFGIKLMLIRHGISGTTFPQNLAIAFIAGLPGLLFIYSALEALHISNSRELFKRLLFRPKR